MRKLATKQRESRYDTYLASVETFHNSAPPVNIIKELRMYPPDNSPHIPTTLQGLANAMGISKQALIRAEQGVYDKPPERIVDWFIKNYGIPYNRLVNGYEQFQVSMRVRHSRLFGDLPTPGQYPNVHPLDHLLTLWTDPISKARYSGSMNVTELAKLLCLSQSVLDHFKNRVKHQSVVPVPLLKALRDAGYTVDELTNLELAYKSYRKSMGLADGLQTPVITESSAVGSLTTGGSIPKGGLIGDILSEVLG